MTVLAVDHGARRIGIAVSDPTETLARPLTILKHISREEDIRRVAQLADERNVQRIVVGQSTDEDGHLNAAGRRALRFADLLGQMTARKIVMWDESMSTQDAQDWRLKGGASRKRRAEPDDALAAAIILQSYLDTMKQNSTDSGDSPI